MNTAQLISQIEALPDNLKEEVADFVAFLAQKHNPKKEIKERQLGVGKGMFEMSPDFDEPLELVESRLLDQIFAQRNAGK